jgi:hypothetical protein
MSQVVDQYLGLKKQLLSLRSEFKQAEQKITEQLSEIESRLLIGMEVTGQTALYSPLGEVRRVETVRYRCDNWESFSSFILQHRSPNLLTRHLNQANLRRFIDDKNQGETPSGISRYLDISLKSHLLDA